MSIQKKIIVRYREDGHVRFEIPDQLCNELTAKTLTSKILNLEGIYRVILFRKQKKLSIKYNEIVCDFKKLATHLFQLITALEQQGQLASNTAQKIQPQNQWTVKSKIKNWKATRRWAAEKYNDAKETVQAAKILTKFGLKKPNSFIKDPEKVLIDFLNDILVLYLIKLHWTRITQEWIPRPWAFRYQWTAVFYLFYLLLRSRRPK
ncbi:MAG: hypothetical protein L3J59_16060 [Methylococcaceae bacterium]|nr:hypothetical protein [Methylococcaceae bacterium]